jgi:hypothetical protein
VASPPYIAVSARVKPWWAPVRTSAR